MANKVLIVDDDVVLLRFMTEFLEGEAFEVIKANNGAEALRLAYREHPDIIILDIMMPGMDGFQVTRRIREMADIPLILLTAKSTEADKLQGFQMGVDDYITKPFSFAELSARIQAVLNRTQRLKAEDLKVIRFGDYLLDLRKREVKFKDELVTLTPTEYRLLEALIKHKGQAVAENDLIKEVWGDYRQEETAAVRRYIWLLRQKMEEDPANPKLILTVRGYGYRIETGSLEAQDT